MSELYLAHDENLSGFVTGGLRLGGVDLFEELLEHPHEPVVILRSENLRNKPSTRAEEKCCQFCGYM